MKRYTLDYELEIEPLFENVEKIRGLRKDRLNYYKLPITAYNFSEENCMMFNHIVSCLEGSHFGKIKRTPSGGISAEVGDLPAYDVRYSGGCIEITIVNHKGSFRLQWRNSPLEAFEDKSLRMSGHQAFSAFKSVCSRFGIDLSRYAHLNSKQAQMEKDQIESAIIRVVSKKFVDREFKNVHHIDFHSSYMSGLVNTHPEFGDVVKYIYENRKQDDFKFKAILNMTQGYMQSKLCNYKYAHLSRDMIKDNNDRIRALVDKLMKNKRLPLLINTDGIWYQGELYHDENEGTGICTWGHDHTNCTLRIKSAGAYEFIENGEYYPVVRGFTKLDQIKPRDMWTWGDIYNDRSEPIQYMFKEGYILWDGEAKGVVDYE